MRFKVKSVATIGSRRLPPALCPYCGATLEGVTGAARDTLDAPEFKAGEFSMCAECGQILFYDGRFYHQVLPEEAERVLRERPLLQTFRDDVIRKRGQRFTSKTGKAKGSVQ